MSPPFHLLVADDDAGLRESLHLALESQGYWITTAGSGGEAIEFARSQFFHCAILDYRMGDMTGIDVVRELLATKSVTTSILLSAELEKTLHAQARLAGFTECLRKPVSPNVLRATVASVLQQCSPTRNN
ncbi:MAG: response regulator transcription factor [Planctomycetes bacterium]|nr:response regulator transcription factor [Planctomycetota bacterium]